MKNSFIIKNADPNFDHYYKQMSRRKNISHFQSESLTYGRVRGRRPAARDSPTGIVYKDYFIVFGGDRHHMPFNDTFYLDLKTDLANRETLFF